MKALVTGASGFIGSHIVDILLEKKFEVTCLLRKSSKTEWLDKKNVIIKYIDFDDHQLLVETMRGAEYVFHSAGLNFAKNKDDYFKINTLGTKKILLACYENKSTIKRFVYISSQTASGPSKSLEEAIDERSESKPITMYGKSKKLAEDEVRNYKDKLPFTILKPTAVFGPRDKAIYSLFKMMYYGFASHVGCNKKYLSLIFVEDLARGIVEAALSDNTIDETYFLSNAEFYNWDYISGVFKKQMNKKLYFKIKIPDFIVLLVGQINGFLSKTFSYSTPFDYDKAIDFTQKYWTCSAEKANRDFGFKQHYSFEDAVKKTYNWYKEHNWL